MSGASRTFRVFVSSTFSDLKAERNALQERVFPRLRELCERHGCRFQAIDLRWGVREEASLDQRTMQICLEEIDRCRRVTPRPNFLILLGDRYGWRPLPYQIAAEEMRRLLPHVPHRDLELLVGADGEGSSGWYRLDENADPTVYRLQPRTGEHTERAAWGDVEGRLRGILREAAAAALPADDPERLKYEASATELEIVRGALATPDPHLHAFGFFRSIKGIEQARDTGEFTDPDPEGRPDPEARERLADLKIRLKELLPLNVREYSAAWSGTEVTKEHLEAFCADVLRSLSAAIEAEIAQREAADPLEQEEEAHEVFAQERSRHFTGRAEPLQRIRGHLSGPASAPLLVTGSSGSGKSALLARALAEARREHPGGVVMARFIGATPESVDAAGLLRSLVDQIYRDFDFETRKAEELQEASGKEYKRADDRKDAVAEVERRYARPSSLSELPECLLRFAGYIPRDRTLILFLDALDQIQGAQRHDLEWLTRLPGTVRAVVSSLEDQRFEALLRQLASVEIGPFPAEDARQVLRFWLSDAGRALQRVQEEAVMQGFRADPRPLYLKLAFEEARRWPSYHCPEPLPGATAELLDLLFARLSREHGELLVSHGLGYLAAARYGLSEDELLDLLARDEEFFGDFLRQARHEVPERSAGVPQLPIAVWSRLYFDLEPYLMERQAPGGTVLAFYHRQPAEAAVRAFLPPDTVRRRRLQLAAYFKLQPSWREGGVPNGRKVTELLFQVREAGDPETAAAAGLDTQLLEAKAESGLREELYEELWALRERARGTAATLLTQVLDSMKEEWPFLGRYPQSLFQIVWNRCMGEGSAPDPSLAEFMERWRRERQEARPGAFWMRSVPAPQDETAAAIPEEGNSPWEPRHLVSPDGERVIDVRLDRYSFTTRVWDRGSHVLITQYPLPRGAYVTAFTPSAWHPDGRRLTVRSMNREFVVFDALTGAESLRVGAVVGEAEAFAYAADGSLLATGTAPREGDALTRMTEAVVAAGQADADEPLVLTKADDDEPIVLTDDGEEPWAEGVFGDEPIFPELEKAPEGDDDDDLLPNPFGDDDGDAFALEAPSRAVPHAPRGEERPPEGEVGVWRVSDGACLQRILHPHGVNRLAFSPDGKRLAFACFGGMVHVHDVGSDQELWSGTTREVAADLCFSPDGKRLGAALLDQTYRVWDADTGELIGGSSREFDFGGGSADVDLRDLVGGSSVSPWLTIGYDASTQIWAQADRTLLAAVPGNRLTPVGDRRWRDPSGSGREWVLEGPDHAPSPTPRPEWPWFIPPDEEDFVLSLGDEPLDPDFERRATELGLLDGDDVFIVEDEEEDGRIEPRERARLGAWRRFFITASIALWGGMAAAWFFVEGMFWPGVISAEVSFIAALLGVVYGMQWVRSRR